MIAEDRKPHLRQIWKDHKPSTWHTLIGTSISREEWLFLCDMWSKRTKPLKSNPTASGNEMVSIVDLEVAKGAKQLDHDEMERLINDLC